MYDDMTIPGSDIQTTFIMIQMDTMQSEFMLEYCCAAELIFTSCLEIKEFEVKSGLSDLPKRTIKISMVNL